MNRLLHGSLRVDDQITGTRANPHVELQDGATRRDYTAREVTGAEKALWWVRAVVAYPDYAAYQRRTDRQIPLFVLTPTPG